jgi:hypothetical protein
MRAATIARTIGASFTLVSLIVIGMTSCGSSSVIRQTVVVTATPQASTVTDTATPTAPATATATFGPLTAAPPRGVWCPVKQGQTPPVSACEIYPSPPRFPTSPQAPPGLAGTQVGPSIGHWLASEVTEYMRDPWAADVVCATNDNSNTGKVQILMVAHTSGGDYYSWGNESCGQPEAPAYGHEFFREAAVSVTLSIKPLTSNLSAWFAMLYQL